MNHPFLTKKTILILFLLLIGGQGFAQKQGQPSLDSISKELSKQKEDSNKVKLMLTYSDGLMSIDLSRAMDLAVKAETLSVKLRWQRGQLKAQMEQARLQAIAGNYSQTIEIALRAATLAEKREDTPMLTDCYTIVGDGYRMLLNLTQSISYYTHALKIAKRINDIPVISKSLIALAEVNLMANNIPQFKRYYEEGEAFAKKQNDLQGQGRLLLIQNDYKFNTGAYSESIAALRKALAIYHQLGSVRFEAYIFARIAYGYASLKNKDSADHYVATALAMTEKYQLEKERMDAYESKFFTEKSFGDYQSALQSRLILDSLTNEFSKNDNTNLTNGIQLKYEQEEQNLIIRQKNENQQKLLLFVSLFTVMLLVFLAITHRQRNRIRRQKQVAERLRKESDALLLNILPAEVAEELKEKGRADAKQFDEVSVLFTDFVHFTQTSAQLTPTQVLQELNECFTAFDNIIERNGLEKIKTIGDAYMAVCGLPISDPRHAQRAVQAALEIRDFIADRHQKEQTFEIRIGVNSGSVVAGIVGVKKFAYDIWGDTVNTASRMESNGEPGKVNISETTYQLIKNEFNCAPRGKINAKGKGEVEMYFVESGQLTVDG